MTTADIAYLKQLADASVGRPGESLRRIRDWIEARLRKDERASRLFAEATKILARAAAQYGVQLPRDVRFRSQAAMAAKRWAAAEMRKLGMSSPEIARAIGFKSHAGALHLLGRWGARKGTT